MNDPCGEIVPTEVLSNRASALLEAQRECRYADVGAELPALIRDLHTTLEAGHDVEPVSHLLALIVPRCQGQTASSTKNRKLRKAPDGNCAMSSGKSSWASGAGGGSLITAVRKPAAVKASVIACSGRCQ